MASETGISGERVLTVQDLQSGVLRVAVGFAPAKVAATLKRAERRVLGILTLQPSIEGNDLVVELPRRSRVGDTVLWQAYEA